MKTIFITGTNSGIGKATVEQFAKNGWNVCASVRNVDEHPDLFQEFENVKLYSLDVTDFKQVEEVAQTVISDSKKIDAIVNNAGYCLIGPTETSTMDQIIRQYETNVFGVFAVSKAFIPHFREKKDGFIINISSSSGQFNFPFIGAYGSSKWAVRGLTEGLGIELSPFNIEVKAIYPGTHATGIFSKLDHGGDIENPAYKAYKPFFSTFISAQSVYPKATNPNNIANEIWKSIEKRNGKLHIVSGGDAKFQHFMKKILGQRSFQKMQIGLIKNKMTAGQGKFAAWLFGKNVQDLKTDIPQNLLD